MAFSHAEAITLWTGVVIFVAILCCIFYQLCSITIKTAIENIHPPKKKKRLNAQEKKVNRILSNQNVREILQSRALTAIKTQENQERSNYLSQLSLDSISTVPDLTDRVICVSFAPEGYTPPRRNPPTLNNTQVADGGSLSDISIGGGSNPPAYDNLSTHSQTSTPSGVLHRH